jgi:hypothetical protein
VSEGQSIAVRLVDYLPRRRPPSARSPQGGSIGDQKQKSGASKWLIWIALGAAVLFAIFRLNADMVSGPDVSNVLSNQQHLAGIAPIGNVRPDPREGYLQPLASVVTLEPLSTDVV